MLGSISFIANIREISLLHLSNLAFSPFYQHAICPNFFSFLIEVNLPYKLENYQRVLSTAQKCKVLWSRLMRFSFRNELRHVISNNVAF